MTEINVTRDHLALLARMDFDWDDGCEWGSVASDCKRPFGNSDVPGGMSEILGREVDHDEARRLSLELSALVNRAVRYAVENPVMVGLAHGTVLTPSWRAGRLLGSA